MTRHGQADVVRAGERRADALRAMGYPRPVASLFGVMIGVLIVQILVHGVHFALEALVLWQHGPGAGIRIALPRLAGLYELGWFVFFVAAPIGCVTWFAWIDRDLKNLYADGIHDLRRTPMQQVMGYMIPGLNLYRPLADLQLLHAGLTEGRNWRRAEDSPLITLWWLASLGQLALMAIELVIGPSIVTLMSSGSSLLVQGVTLALLRQFATAHPYWRLGARPTTAAGAVPEASSSVPGASAPQPSFASPLTEPAP